MPAKKIIFLIMLALTSLTFSMDYQYYKDDKPKSYFDTNAKAEEQARTAKDFAFFYAVSIDDDREVEALLDNHNINVNMRDLGGLTPLMTAIMKCSRGSIPYLLHHKADVNAISRHPKFYLGYSPLAIAAEEDKGGAILVTLLRKGATLHFTTPKEETILILAVKKLNVIIVEYLINKTDINIHAKDKDGLTALDHINRKAQYIHEVKSSHRQKIEQIQSLLKSKANL